MTCSAIGIELTPEMELSWSLGPPLHWCLDRLGVPGQRMEEAIAVFERAHLERIGLVTPIDGADVVIPKLAAEGVAIGVATIKPQGLAELVLEHLGIRACVSVVHGRADDMDPRTKTDLLRAAAAELSGTSPLYVGDHDSDEEAAAALGIPFMRFPQVRWEDVGSRLLG